MFCSPLILYRTRRLQPLWWAGRAAGTRLPPRPRDWWRHSLWRRWALDQGFFRWGSGRITRLCVCPQNVWNSRETNSVSHLCVSIQPVYSSSPRARPRPGHVPFLGRRRPDVPHLLLRSGFPAGRGRHWGNSGSLWWDSETQLPCSSYFLIPDTNVGTCCVQKLLSITRCLQPPAVNMIYSVFIKLFKGRPVNILSLPSLSCVGSL